VGRKQRRQRRPEASAGVVGAAAGAAMRALASSGEGAVAIGAATPIGWRLRGEIQLLRIDRAGFRGQRPERLIAQAPFEGEPSAAGHRPAGADAWGE